MLAAAFHDEYNLQTQVFTVIRNRNVTAAIMAPPVGDPVRSSFATVSCRIAEVTVAIDC